MFHAGDIPPIHAPEIRSFCVPKMNPSHPYHSIIVYTYRYEHNRSTLQFSYNGKPPPSRISEARSVVPELMHILCKSGVTSCAKPRFKFVVGKVVFLFSSIPRTLLLLLFHHSLFNNPHNSHTPQPFIYPLFIYLSNFPISFSPYTFPRQGNQQASQPSHQKRQNQCGL